MTSGQAGEGEPPAVIAGPSVRPRRVLIVAEHASAQFGGEAALPLHYFRVLRRRGHPVWLITHARTRDELERLYPQDPQIHYIEDTRLHRAMWQLGQRLPPRISYLTTGFISRIAVQLEQRGLVRRLVRSEGIDVVHQPMPVSPREPSLLHGFGVPVVIGPMNGGMRYPPAFEQKRAAEEILVGLGRKAADLINRVMPGKRRAAVLLVANERTRGALPAGNSGSVVELVENGVDLSVWDPVAAPPAPTATDSPLVSFVYLGRLVDWKRVDLLLQAFARVAGRVAIRLTIVGSGDEEAALRRQADELGISATSPTSAGVTFAGWRSQRECAALLGAADGLVLPSVLECGGAVVLEAMAMGKPVIATAWGGPLDYLDADCGILVAPDSVEALVDGLAAAMARLASAPDERRRLGANGRDKVLRLYDWDVKVDRMLEVYDDAIRIAGERRKTG